MPSLRWIAVSYFLIAGLLIAAHACTVLFESFAPDAVIYAIAALAGGFAAGRTSRGYTVIEPALAAALVVGSLFVADRVLGELVSTPLSMSEAGVAFGGAVLGGILGEVSQGESARRPVLDALVASLILAGVVFVCFLFTVTVLAAMGFEPTELLGFFVAIAALFLAGMMIQAAFPFPAAQATFAAAAIDMTVFSVVFVATVQTTGAIDYVMIAITGVVVAGLVGLLTMVGASACWTFYGDTLASTYEGLPEATARETSPKERPDSEI